MSPTEDAAELARQERTSGQAGPGLTHRRRRGRARVVLAIVRGRHGARERRAGKEAENGRRMKREDTREVGECGREQRPVEGGGKAQTGGAHPHSISIGGEMFFVGSHK